MRYRVANQRVRLRTREPREGRAAGRIHQLDLDPATARGVCVQHEPVPGEEERRGRESAALLGGLPTRIEADKA